MRSTTRFVPYNKK